MGFMDKVKSQATQVAQKAQDGVKTGQSKLEGAQAKKRQDALLRDLGALLYAERTGNATGETAAEMERILSELRTLEAEAGPATPAGSAGQGDTGDYNLDDL